MGNKIDSQGRDRCEHCGSIVITEPENYDVEERLELLGYLAEDTYHKFGDGQTYHGHAVEGTDTFNEVRQGHDSDRLHEIAKKAFANSNLRCPRHWDLKPKFCKSVSPTSKEFPLFAQGKCKRCECVVLTKP